MTFHTVNARFCLFVLESSLNFLCRRRVELILYYMSADTVIPTLVGNVEYLNDLLKSPCFVLPVDGVVASCIWRNIKSLKLELSACLVFCLVFFLAPVWGCV